MTIKTFGVISGGGDSRRTYGFGGVVNMPAGKFLDHRMTVDADTTFKLFRVDQIPYDSNTTIKVVESPTNTRGGGTQLNKTDDLSSGDPITEKTYSSETELAFRLDNEGSNAAEVGGSVTYSTS